MDERTLNDLLECSICLEMLGDSSKVLPCQHTFCRKCLEVIVASQSELRCPECRVLVEIKIEDLPPNVLLMRILEGMKNATSMSQSQTNNSSSTTKSPTQPATDQNLQEQQVHTLSSSTTSSLNQKVQSPPQQPASAQQHQQQQPQHQQSRPQGQPITTNNVPYAKALYDYASKETGDLNFKKGDKIYLHRRIDLNWLIGECNGRDGAFPVNYVQVIIPLPIPQCKALYDFRMGPNEEEGCLTFKKGAIISVYRRVDHNWAEGQIGDCIGIFPIAFVEMNALAKQMMDVSAKYIHYVPSTRSIPPTPIEQTTPQPPAPPELNSFSSDSSSTITTSPNSSTSSSMTSSPSSSIPHQQLPATTVPHPQTAADVKREKRYSLNVLNSSSNNSAAVHSAGRNPNRHSAELLAPPSLPPPNDTTPKAIDKAQRHGSKTTTGRNDGHGHPIKSVVNNTNLMNQHRQRHNSPTTTTTPPPPNAFVALHPYRPQKPDELELKKGSVYYVSERCQDGWFKGTNRSQKSGVFPGNYVTPLRALHAMSGGAVGAASKRHSGHFTSSNEANNGTHVPPELPPRSRVSDTSGSSSVWSKPLGQHVEALFGRKSSNNSSHSSSTHNKSDSNSHSNVSNKKDPNIVSTTSSSSSTVSLIKRITNIKRSKSPVNSSAPSYSMDNPVFEDIAGASATPPLASNKRNTIHLSHPVHVRSGSCPSQLLQSLPIDINATQSTNGVSGTANTTKNVDAHGNASYMFGSQRVKGHKERPTLLGMRNNFEANRHRNESNGSHTTQVAQHQSHQNQHHVKTSSHHSSTTSTSSSSHHRKSQSLDVVTGSAQNKHTNNVHREKFRCIVSYPPNSEFELELQLGDIVWVHKKRDNGWYKGTHARTGKVGLFPSSFVEPDI